MADEDLTEAEVRAAFIDSQIFERAMEMMDRDRTVELEGLSDFFDGDKSDQSSFVNPLGGNRIIARGSVGRWDGTSHGLTAYRDFDDMMRGADSVFKDCEIGKVWDENGSLFVHGYHHDGGVDVELRQLTDAGEEALDAIEDAWVGEEFTIAGKTYDGSAQSTMDALDDLWENPALCPAPHYMELAFGCPAEEWEEPTLDPLLAIAEFTPSAIMSAEVASGVVSATVLDISGTPYTVPVDVLKGLKEEVKEFNTDNPKTEVEQTARGSEPEHPVIGGDEVWKQKNVLIDRNGDDALVMRKMADGSREFVVAHDYDEETGHWGHGTYYDSLASAAADLEGRAISAPGEEVICPDFWYRADIESALENAGLEVNDANVDATLEALELDGDPIFSNFHDHLAETGNEMIADAVDGIEPDDTDGLDLDAEARDMRGVADGMTDRQLGTPSLGGQGR